MGATDIVPAEAVELAIEQEFVGAKAKFVPTNVTAFRAGHKEGRKVRQEV